MKIHHLGWEWMHCPVQKAQYPPKETKTIWKSILTVTSQNRRMKNYDTKQDIRNLWRQ